MKIHIDIRDDISTVDALDAVSRVISKGRVSKNNTMYCFLTIFSNRIAVSTNEYRKSDCFTVWKYKNQNK